MGFIDAEVVAQNRTTRRRSRSEVRSLRLFPRNGEEVGRRSDCRAKPWNLDDDTLLQTQHVTPETQSTLTDGASVRCERVRPESMFEDTATIRARWRDQNTRVRSSIRARIGLADASRAAAGSSKRPSLWAVVRRTSTTRRSSSSAPKSTAGAPFVASTEPKWSWVVYLITLYQIGVQSVRRWFIGASN